MHNFRKNTKVIYLQIAKDSSQDFYCPILVGLLVQAFSYLQASSISFLLTFPTSSLSHYLVLPTVHDLFSIITLTPIFDIFSSNNAVTAAWWLQTVYFLLFLGAFVYILYLILAKKSLPSKIMTTALLIHSQILFFPIHYFLLNFITEYSKCSDSANSVCKTELFAIAAILLVLNIILASCKELSFYQIAKGKSPFSCKTNIVSQILLFQKMVVTCIFVVLKDSVVGSRICALINLLLFLTLCLILYLKLPFYQMPMTQTLMILSGFSVVLSIISVFKVFHILKDSPGLEAILFFGTTFAIKLLLLFLKRLESRILQFDYGTPEQAVHLPILLNRAISLYSPFPKLHRKFNREMVSYCGLINSQLIDMDNLQDNQRFTEYENTVYTKIIEKFTLLLRKYPHSEVLRLCMAHIYLSKLKNGSKAITLLRSIKLFSNSAPIINSIQMTLGNLEKQYSMAYQEDNKYLDTVKFFEYRDIANTTKEAVQSEITKHIEFWKELAVEKVDLLKMINLADGVCNVSLSIKKLWNKHGEEFSKKFETPVLLYGVYLETVKDLPHEAWPLLSNCFSQRKINSRVSSKYEMIEAILSESSAIIMGSTEPDKLGKIVDASASVSSMFNITKEKLLDQKIDILMPNIIAKRHDNFIQNYNMSPTFKLNTELNTIARTIDGYFFSVEICLKICPVITNGVCVMSFIKRLSENEPILIVDHDDIIMDCSKHIERLFKIEKSLLHGVKVQKICPELADGLAALSSQYVVSSEKTKEENQIIQPMTSQGPDFVKGAKDYFTTKTYVESEMYENCNLIGQNEDLDKLSPKRKTLNLNFETQQTINSPSMFSSRRKFSGAYTNFQEQNVYKNHIKDKETVGEVGLNYKKGYKLTLTSTDSNIISTKEGQHFHVKIEPFFVSGNFYKLIKLKQDSENQQSPLSPTKPEHLSKVDATSNMNSLKKREVGDCLSVASENIIVNSITANKTNLLNMRLSDTKIGQQIENKKVISMSSLSQNQNIEANDFVETRANEASSLKENSRSEARVVMRTLNDTLSQEKVRTTTKLSLLFIYLATLVVILSATIDYTLTGNSIKNTRDSALVIDTANKRLYHNVILLQYILGIYSTVSSISRSSLKFLQDSLYATTMKMIEQNDILKIKLQELDNNKIKRVFFKKKIALWDPSIQTKLNSQLFDSFTASNILAIKDLYVANYTSPNSSLTVTISKLRSSNEMLFALNNTFNDYLITMEEEIKEMEEILADIINNNLLILKLILSLENMALLLLTILLSSLVKIIVDSHNKMFKAIVSIHPQSIARRIEKLERLQLYIKENIELKKFSHGLNSFLENFEKSKKNSSKLSRVKFLDSRLNIRGLIVYMIKYLAFTTLIILCVGGIFCASSLASADVFTRLETINGKLAVTHKLGYQIDNILSNFGQITVLYNRTDLKIRNEDPNIQLSRNLKVLSDANLVLVDILSGAGKQFDDDVVENFLKNDICTYLTSVTPTLFMTCVSATVGAPGLLNLNLKYFQDVTFSWENFRKNPSVSNGNSIFTSLASKSSASVFTLQAAYEFLTRRLLSQFEEEVDSQRFDRLLYFVIILLSIILATIMIKIIALDKFRSIDIGIKKVLRMIPYEVIKENKVIGFYLSKELDKEIEGIKKYL